MKNELDNLANKPIDILSPEELEILTKTISELPHEQAEPLLIQIEELKKRKRDRDEVGFMKSAVRWYMMNVHSIKINALLPW